MSSSTIVFYCHLLLSSATIILYCHLLTSSFTIIFSHHLLLSSIILFFTIIFYHHAVLYLLTLSLQPCSRSDKTGQAPIHIAAHWKLVDILNLLITARSNVNIIDNKGRTPLYICVSALSTKLYAEDLCHQFPCIVTLFRAGADMLNLIEWLLYKGPGISEELLNSAPDFRTWYAMQIRQPLSLKNMCRKAIQMRICTSRNANLVKITRKLPIPLSLQGLVCRKMFYREEHYYDPNMNIQNATLES